MKKIFIIIILLLTATCRFQLKAAKRALIIGISCYEQHKLNQLDWHPIHGTNDVAMIGATLKKQGFSVARLTNNKATAQNIRKAFIALTRQSQTGDIIYIHFSGHGQPVEDCNGDEPDGWDEAIVPYDAGQKYVKNVYDGRNHIIDDELNDLVTGIRRKVGKSGFVYVVIDACHSGGSSRGEEKEDSVYMRGTAEGFSRSGKRFVPRIDKRAVISMPTGKNMANACYLEACRSYQTNVEIRVGKHYYGSISYYINKVLEKHQLTKDTQWTENVRKLMSADCRLLRQNMVVERSGI